jgi:hypothetical protein
MPACGTELLARALLQLHSRDLCCQVVSDTAQSFVIKPKRKALFWDCLEKICAFSGFDLDPCFPHVNSIRASTSGSVLRGPMLVILRRRKARVHKTDALSCARP